MYSRFIIESTTLRDMKIRKEMINKITLICAAMLMCSCLGKDQQDSFTKELQIEFVEEDTTIYLTPKQSTQPYCKLSLNIKFVKGKYAQAINNTIINSNILAPEYLPHRCADMGLKEIVDLYIEKYLSDYRNSYEMLYMNDKENAEYYNNSYKLDTETEINKKGILTYIAKTTIKNGNNDAVCKTVVHNINIKDGKILSLSDIFKHGYENTIKTKLRKELEKQLDDDTNKTHINKDDLYIPNNFIIRNNKITFIYCEGDILSLKNGEIRIDIYNKDMEGLLRESNL